MIDGGRERMTSSVGPFSAEAHDYAPLPASIGHNAFSTPGVQYIPGGTAPRTLKPPTGEQQNVPRRSLIDPSKVRRNFPTAATVAKPVFVSAAPPPTTTSPSPVRELHRPVLLERPRTMVAPTTVTPPATPPSLVSFDRPVVADDFPYRTCQVEQRLEDLECEVERKNMELAETRKFCERLKHELSRSNKMCARLKETEADLRDIPADGDLSEEARRCLAGSAVFRERAGLIISEREVEWGMRSALEGITSVKDRNRALRERIEMDATVDARNVIERLERDLQVVVKQMQASKQALKNMDTQMFTTAAKMRQIRARKDGDVDVSPSKDRGLRDESPKRLVVIESVKEGVESLKQAKSGKQQELSRDESSKSEESFKSLSPKSVEMKSPKQQELSRDGSGKSEDSFKSLSPKSVEMKSGKREEGSRLSRDALGKSEDTFRVLSPKRMNGKLPVVGDSKSSRDESYTSEGGGKVESPVKSPKRGGRVAKTAELKSSNEDEGSRSSRDETGTSDGGVKAEIPVRQSPKRSGKAAKPGVKSVKEEQGSKSSRDESGASEGPSKEETPVKASPKRANEKVGKARKEEEGADESGTSEGGKEESPSKSPGPRARQVKKKVVKKVVRRSIKKGKVEADTK